MVWGGSEGDRSGSGGRGPKEEGAGSVASITELMSFMRWVCGVESVRVFSARMGS